jgi:hypothetical protein
LLARADTVFFSIQAPQQRGALGTKAGVIHKKTSGSDANGLVKTGGSRIDDSS